MKKKISRSIVAAFTLLMATSSVFGQGQAESKSLLVVPLQSATLKKSALSKLNRALTSKVDGQGSFEVKSMRPVQSSAEYKIIKDQNCQSSGCVLRLAVLAESDLVLSGQVESRYNTQQLSISLYHVSTGSLLGHVSFPEKELNDSHIDLALKEVLLQYQAEKNKIAKLEMAKTIPGVFQLVADKVAPDSLEISIRQAEGYAADNKKIEVCLSEDAAGCLPFEVSEEYQGDKSLLQFDDLEYDQTYFISVRVKQTQADKEPIYSPVSVLRQATAPISVSQPPQFDKKPGYYTDSFPLVLSSTTDAATICYTTDNTEPSCIKNICTSGKTYEPGQAVFQSTTVQAMSCREGYANSSIVTGEFTVEPKNKDGLPRLSILPFTRVFEKTRNNRTIDKRINFFDQELQSRQKFYALNQKTISEIPEYKSIIDKQQCNDVNCIISMSKFLNCRYAIQGYFTSNKEGQSIEVILLEVATGKYFGSAAVNAEAVTEEQIKLLVDKLISEFEAEVQQQEAIANSRFNPEYYNIVLPGAYDSKTKKPNFTLLSISAGAVALSTVLGIAAAEQIKTSNTTKTTADFSKAETAVTASSLAIMATAGFYLVNGFITVGRHKMFIPAEIPTAAEGGGTGSEANTTSVFIEQANDRFTQTTQTRVSVNFKF